MGGKFPVDIPPISNYIPGISDQFPLSSFAVWVIERDHRAVVRNYFLSNFEIQYVPQKRASHFVIFDGTPRAY
jgi:hypothetical protein